MKRFANTNFKNVAGKAWNTVATSFRAYGNAARAGFRGTTLPTNYNTDMVGVATQAGYIAGVFAKGIKMGANTVWVKTKPALKTIGNGLYTMGKYVVRVTTKVLNGVKGWLIKVIGTIAQFSKSAGTQMKRGITNAKAAMKDGWKSFKPKAKTAARHAAATAKKAAKKAWDVVDGQYVKVADKITKPLRPKGTLESQKRYEYRQAKRDMVVRRRATAMEAATVILAHEGIKRWDIGNSKEDEE